MKKNYIYFFMLNNQFDIFIISPLEQFEVTSLLSFNAPLFGYFTFTLTNLALYSILILFLILGLHYMGNNDTKLLPSKWSISIESLFSSINSMVKDQIGTSNEMYLPFIYSLFCFVLFANLIGNIPYSFTLTSSAIVCLSLSISIFIGVTILGVYTHNLKFFSFFLPSGTPVFLVPLLVLIETISYLARAVSLGVRLFANIVAGHSLLNILSSFLFKLFSSSFSLFFIMFIPFILFIILVGLELFVSFIQAYVFCLLVSSYLKDVINLH
jgi:F-type H+-transporting ATPase subunit a